jgi:hypothetical protein
LPINPQVKTLKFIPFISLMARNHFNSLDQPFV